MTISTARILLSVALLFLVVSTASSKGEAQRRWERMNQIRQEKFDLVLPEVMRENDVDMWITVNREGFEDPLTDDFGRGYVGDYGYYIFTDRGDGRIERAILGIGTALIEQNVAYDIFGSSAELREFVEERDPQTIALNYARNIGAADGLSYTSYQKLTEELGARFAERFVSAEKLASDFRSRRVASEIAAFAWAGEMSRNIAERAFSNEVITPGKPRSPMSRGGCASNSSRTVSIHLLACPLSISPDRTDSLRCQMITSSREVILLRSTGASVISTSIQT